MTKFYFLLLLSLFLMINVSGQTNTTLAEAIDELRASIKEVPGGKITFEQSVEWDATVPHKLIFKQDKVGKKKTLSMSYEVSLKDIDKNTIRVKNKKDLMLVSIFINHKQHLIKVFKNGEQEKYTEQMTLMALDNDNGLVIQKALENAINLAKHITSSCDPTTFEDRINWLAANIQQFRVNETTFEQTFEQIGSSNTMVSYKIIERAKKTKEEFWAFNLADLNPRKIKLHIKGNSVFVEVQCKGNGNYIYYEKDGKQENYTNKLSFLMDDFDKARCLISILEKLIKDSEGIDKKKYTAPASLQTSLEVLHKIVGDVKREGIDITQSLKASCVTEFSRTEKKAKKEAIEEVFKFNLSDIQTKSIKVKVKGKAILVELSTGKTKLIQPFKNKEIQKYTGKLNINAHTLENAKMLSFILSATVGFCKKENSFIPSKNVSENLSWISEQLTKVNDIANLNQSIKSIEGEQCKWQFTSLTTGKKKDKEEIFEFNLENLDEKAIQFNISGKTLSIKIDTRHHEKVIKYYKDGEPDDYKNSFLIQLHDFEDARNMIRVFEEGVKGCKG